MLIIRRSSVICLNAIKNPSRKFPDKSGLYLFIFHNLVGSDTFNNHFLKLTSYLVWAGEEKLS
jgi:hypothetical protein